MSMHFQLRKKCVSQAVIAFFLTEFPFQIWLTVFLVHKNEFEKKDKLIPDGPNISGKHTRRLKTYFTEGFSYQCATILIDTEMLEK